MAEEDLEHGQHLLEVLELTTKHLQEKKMGMEALSCMEQSLQCQLDFVV